MIVQPNPPHSTAPTTTGAVQPNPLNGHFETDQPVMELQLNTGELKSLICNAGTCETLLMGYCWFPPLSVALLPFGLWCPLLYQYCAASKSTGARHLMLRANSLQLRVDPCQRAVRPPPVERDAVGNAKDFSEGCDHQDDACCHGGGEFGGILESCCQLCMRMSSSSLILQTLPLQEIESCEFVPCTETGKSDPCVCCIKVDCCCPTGEYNTAPSTLVVSSPPIPAAADKQAQHHCATAIGQPD